MREKLKGKDGNPGREKRWDPACRKRYGKVLFCPLQRKADKALQF